MSDTMTLYAGDKEVALSLEATPDPREPGHMLLKTKDNEPMRGRLSLQEHAYNVMLMPGSYIIILADEAVLFQDSRSDDRVNFILPSDNPDDFYLERYVASSRGKEPFTVLILKFQKTHKMISAALYPRDLEDLPTPRFYNTADKIVTVSTKRTDETVDGVINKTGHAHNPADLDFILDEVYQTNEERLKKAAADAPKEEWF